jgi:hypothetical protein
MSVQKFDPKKDYYAVLGVSEDATAADLDRAFRGAARKRHPDGGGSEEAMKSLNEAHDILSDPETRQAYDAERKPKRVVHTASPVFDPEAASRAGTLHIPVSDPDFAGLLMGAIACIGVGIPLLFLVEMQWMFFLWPLRIGALGALAIGVYLSHSALRVKQRKIKRATKREARRLVFVTELLFWVVAFALLGALIGAWLYVIR